MLVGGRVRKKDLFCPAHVIDGFAVSALEADPNETKEASDPRLSTIDGRLLKYGRNAVTHMFLGKQLVIVFPTFEFSTVLTRL